MSAVAAIVEFSPERLLQGGVIAGIIFMVFGLTTVLGSGIITDMLYKKEENRDYVRNVVRIFGAVLLLIGGVTAVMYA